MWYRFLVLSGVFALHACTGQQLDAPGTPEAPEPERDSGVTRGRTPDDPESCVTADSAAREAAAWKAAVVEQLENALRDQPACFTRGGAVNGHQLAFGLQVNPTGRGTLSVQSSDPDMCFTKACLQAAIQGLRFPLPPPGTDSSASMVTTSLTYYPLMTSPLVLGVPLIELHTDSDCVDGPPPPKSDAIPQQSIDSVIEAHEAAFLDCYSQGLSHNEALQGEMVTLFVVSPEGRVAGVETLNNTVPDCEVVACVRQVFSTLTFPRYPGPEATVAYPHTFAPLDTDSSLPTLERQRAIPPQQDRPPTGEGATGTGTDSVYWQLRNEQEGG